MSGALPHLPTRRSAAMLRRSSESTPLVAPEGSASLARPGRSVSRPRALLLALAASALLLGLAHVSRFQPDEASLKGSTSAANEAFQAANGPIQAVNEQIQGANGQSRVMSAAEGVACGLQGQESGYVALPNAGGARYFYWFAPSQAGDAAEDPLVLWLTGGPGCSSMLALLAENGPCRLNADLSTERNPHAWTRRANVVWLDQPAGVGFSHGPEAEPKADPAAGGPDVGESIYWFLQEFLRRHPELAARPLFIAGESFAGHYVPAASSYILKANAWRQQRPGALHLNLAGISIGNGITDAGVQYQHSTGMIDNAYNVSLLSADEVEAMREAQPICLDLISQCQNDRAVCFDAVEFCLANLETPYFRSGRNPYDIRKPCEKADVMECSSYDHVRTYLNSPEVLTAMGVDTTRSKAWRECDPGVSAGLAMDQMISFADDVKLALEAGVRVLAYAGDADLMCNWVGNQAWVMNLEWSGKRSFNEASNRPLTLGAGDETSAGDVRSFENLAFVRVFNAGHMVPVDQPEVAVEMMSRFFHNADL